MSSIYRSSDEKVIAGVCAGIAHKLDLNVTGLRWVVALTTLFLSGVPALVYLVLWVVLKERSITVDVVDIEWRQIVHCRKLDAHIVSGWKIVRKVDLKITEIFSPPTVQRRSVWRNRTLCFQRSGAPEICYNTRHWSEVWLVWSHRDGLRRWSSPTKNKLFNCKTVQL